MSTRVNLTYEAFAGLYDRAEAAESRIAGALRLHTGFHKCGDDYYTDGEKYTGTIAKRGQCPTARALEGRTS